MLRIGSLLTAAFLGGTLTLAAQEPILRPPTPLSGPALPPSVSSATPSALPAAVVSPVPSGYPAPMQMAPSSGQSPNSGLLPRLLGKSPATLPAAPPSGPAMLPGSYPAPTEMAPGSGQSQYSGLIPRLRGKTSATLHPTPPTEPTMPTYNYSGSPEMVPGSGQKYTGLLPRLAARMNSGPPPMAAPAEDSGKDKISLVGYFAHRPCQLTSPHYLYMPYNPRPPLYLYFLYPPLLEHGPHEYPPNQCKNCWNGRCSAGPHMFALPSMQNAGFSDGGPGPYPPFMTPGPAQGGQGQGTSGPGMGSPPLGMGSSGRGSGFSSSSSGSGF